MTFDYDLIPPGYYDFRETGLRHRWHHIEFKTVESYVLKTGPRLLIDLGCGPGVFLRNYCDSIESKIGFDISKKQVKYANVFATKNLSFHYSIESLLKQIECNNWDEGITACITGIELIEHLTSAEMRSLVSRITKSLREKGVSKISLVFTTPNKRSLWPIVERLIDFFLKTNYREQHIAIMNYRQFRSVIKSVSGVEPTALFSFMSIPQWLFLKPPCAPISKFMLRGMLMLSYVDNLG